MGQAAEITAQANAAAELISSDEHIIALLLQGTPLLDVRAPVEFRRGALPAATNIPLLDDSQRAAVGKRYRQGGREAAIAQGHSLITGSVKAQRLADWRRFLSDAPDAVLYCFRGGLRSEIVQQWLTEPGLAEQGLAEQSIAVPRISGGYKRVRQLLLTRLQTLATTLPLMIIAGRTGSGKTHLLARLSAGDLSTGNHENNIACIDLEGLANHRGSAFGQRPGGQPSQADFENRLSLAMLRNAHCRRMFLEDESRAIGTLCLPQSLHQSMGKAPMALLQVPIAERSRTIMQDYILSDYAALQQADIDSASALFSKNLRGALTRIQKRLGGDNYRRIAGLMDEALQAHLQQGESEGHLHWIAALLKTYYDPMYDYQLANKGNEVVFHGSPDEFLIWAGAA